jgi:uncharacterized membrane protein HdeD (DUF308 family)
MSSTRALPEVSSPMLTALANSWWLLLLRGIAAIAFGVLAFAWPGVTLLMLIILYGAYVLVDGCLALAAVVTGRGGAVPTGWLILIGLLSIAAGLLTFFWPGLTALVLILFMGGWALASGIVQIIGAIQLRKEIDNEWLLIMAGILSVLFGLGVLIFPGAGALAMVWAIAAYAIVYGILLISLAWRVRKAHP